MREFFILASFQLMFQTSIKERESRLTAREPNYTYPRVCVERKNIYLDFSLKN